MLLLLLHVVIFTGVDQGQAAERGTLMPVMAQQISSESAGMSKKSAGRSAAAGNSR